MINPNHLAQELTDHGLEYVRGTLMLDSHEPTVVEFVDRDQDIDLASELDCGCGACQGYQYGDGEPYDAEAEWQAMWGRPLTFGELERLYFRDAN